MRALSPALPLLRPGTGTIRASRAQPIPARGYYASKDTVVQTQLNPASEVAVSFPAQDRIEVITSRNADLFFARIFGMA